MTSIRTQLSFSLSLSLVVILIGQWFLVSHAIKMMIEDYAYTRLDQDSQSLLAALKPTPQDNKTLFIANSDPRFHQPLSGFYYQIIIGDTVLRSRSLWDFDLNHVVVSIGNTVRNTALGPGQQTLLVLTRGFKKSGQHIVIAVSEDASPIRDNIAQFQTYYAIVSVAILLILVGSQFAMLKRSFRPMDDVQRDLEQLEHGNKTALDVRVPDELKPLVSQINTLMQLMQNRLIRYRNSLGNLAHSLKTPLTRLNQLLEHPAICEEETLKKQVRHQNELISLRIDHELKRARFAGDSGFGHHYDLEQEVSDLIKTLRAIYRHKTLHFESIIQPLDRNPCDREDLHELLGNLLDNACKWARDTVLITVTDNKGFRLTIEDNGPGCEKHDITLLTSRGIRLDEEVQGHGLGLAIVKDIAEAYGGSVQFNESQRLGGFAVTLSIPNKNKVM